MGEKQAVVNSTNSAATAVKKKEMRVESLGWLTESTVMPKKHKAIEGVGASSILELKAQLYRSQQEAKSTKQSEDEYQRAKSRIVHVDISSRKNSGVDARAHRLVFFISSECPSRTPAFSLKIFRFVIKKNHHISLVCVCKLL